MLPSLMSWLVDAVQKVILGEARWAGHWSRCSELQLVMEVGRPVDWWRRTAAGCWARPGPLQAND